MNQRPDEHKKEHAILVLLKAELHAIALWTPYIASSTHQTISTGMLASLDTYDVWRSRRDWQNWPRVTIPSCSENFSANGLLWLIESLNSRADVSPSRRQAAHKCPRSTSH
jgi:hypothetical protein